MFLEFLKSSADFLLHIDVYLATLIQTYGVFTYVILFLVIFLETGLVVTPLLPGDSLLFAVGTFASLGLFNAVFAFFLLSFAAIIGDTLNYWVGFTVGPRVFQKDQAMFFKKEYLQRTEKFYEKHGGKTIILARFFPIIRTFAPFVAGVGKMRYPRFLLYNVAGGVAWVAIFVFGGFIFGNIPFVQENFSFVIFYVIGLSFIPAFFEFLRRRFHI